MEDRDEIIREKMLRLISKSCQFDKRPNEQFRDFHKAFLNFFFSSVDVDVNYENKLISIWNSKPLTTDPVRLYDLNEAISDRVGYNDLEETLIGCLEDGQLQHNFYRKMLVEFGDHTKDDQSCMSA